jgi:hypothetical protein
MELKKLISLAFATLLFSCGTSVEEANSNTIKEEAQDISQEEKDNPEEKAKTQQESSEAKNVVLAFYVGSFDAQKMDAAKNPMLQNRINISLDSIKDDVLFGHSVVAGNIRPFKGSFKKENELYIAVCKEPGDDKYDGVFTFTLNPQDESIKGRWNSNDKKLAVSERSYDLKKVDFKYDPNLGLEVLSAEVYNSYREDTEEHEQITTDAGKINASVVVLKKEDVENMYKRDLEVMRNAIYARHGYSFKNRQMRYFFDNNVSWYIPVSTDITNELTELEKQNIALIKRYEKHASSYYDTYGR